MAIPDASWGASQGGVSGSAASATADTVGMLNWTTSAIKGHVAAGSYVSDELKTECATKGGAAAAMASAVASFSAALAEASDETLNSSVMAPWQMETPLFMLAQIAVSHVWYHDGQLNYIQAILGDPAVHWMDE